ncbi:MAG TPA: 50S ribosomal protein L10, partial [Thermodesulfobacteriota bacterium]|nr:50S ribosomal protein L10 [Thermodesulfobacteriota bacterium]
MLKEKKNEVVAALQEKLGRAEFNILTDFKGLKVAEFTQLRRELKEAGGELAVVKNTLLKLAAGDSATASLEKFLVGPTAIILGYQNPVEIAKIVSKYAKDKPDNFILKAGVLGQSVLTDKDVVELAKMPPREVLLAKLLGALQGVPTSLVSLLSGIL